MHAEGFPPVANGDAAVLIVGSLPGPLSLRMRQYYAKPQNAFWPIMGQLVGATPALAYADRLERLKARRIALWDVCHAAFRPGGLDTAILPSSVVANDFERFLRDHPGIRLICFNGSKAADLFARQVCPRLPDAMRAIRRIVLPSTSPAHAAMPFAEKLGRWHEALAWAVPLDP